MCWIGLRVDEAWDQRAKESNRIVYLAGATLIDLIYAQLKGVTLHLLEKFIVDNKFGIKPICVVDAFHII